MTQDFHAFLEQYRAQHPDDVLVIDDEVSPDQEVTAVVWALAAQGRDPLVVFNRVKGTKVATNMFASRARIARLLGTTPDKIHHTYQEKARKAVDPKVVAKGPILDSGTITWISAAPAAKTLRDRQGAVHHQRPRGVRGAGEPQLPPRDGAFEDGARDQPAFARASMARPGRPSKGSRCRSRWSSARIRSS